MLACKPLWRYGATCPNQTRLTGRRMASIKPPCSVLARHPEGLRTGRVVCLASESVEPSTKVLPYELPDTIKQAIEVGNSFAKQQEWATALEVYQKSMTLAGTGIKRFRDKPPGISDGEKAAALYNVACCHSQMANVVPGLVAISEALEAGYRDFRQLRSDTDLQNLRVDPRFEILLTRYEPKPATGFLGGLQKFFTT